MAGNDLIVPNVTAGAGRLPEGFSKWCAINSQYLNFQVLGSRCSIYAKNDSDTIDTHLVMWPSLGVNCANTTLLGMKTMRYFKSKLMLNRVHGHSTTAHLSQYMSTKKITANPALGQQSLCGAYTTSPAAVWYWNIGCVQDAALAPNVRIYIDMTYYVRFYSANEINDVVD